MTALDEDYLRELAYEQQTAVAHAAQAGTHDRCPSCSHRWHGLACKVTGGYACSCPSSFTPHAKEASA